MENIIVFYDAQNFNNVKYYELVERAINKHGRIAVARIYHDFVGKDNPWKQLCFQRGMKPCQITSPKKNTADLLITIDALKIAFGNDDDIFCFVTNDSDFYPISLELKQMGIKTMLVTSKPMTKANLAQVDEYWFSIVEHVDLNDKNNNAPKPSRVSGVPQGTSVSNDSKPNNVEQAQLSISGKNNVDQVQSGADNKATATRLAESDKVEVAKAAEEAKAAEQQRIEELKQLPSKIKQYISSRYGGLKRDADGWASYGTLCSGLKKKFADIDYKAIGYKDKKDMIIKSGYEIDKNNFRPKK